MRSDLLFWGAATVALLASGAVNSADLRPAAKIPPALWSWTGGYIGGHVGRGYGPTSFSDPYGPSLYGDVVDTPVFLAGGQIGCNWQTERWVFGVEFDASGAVSERANTCLAASGFVVSANCNASPSVFVTGTARLRYLFRPQRHTLAYLNGGAAWQHNRGDVVNNNEFFGLAPQNATHFDYGDVGGPIGLGVEQALTPAWSVKLEYDYLRFGGPNLVTPPTTQYLRLVTVPANFTTLSSSYHVGKLGLNYYFDPGPWTQAWSDAPLYATKPTVSASPIALPNGWSLEGGIRLWLSRGRLQFDDDAGALGSRLSYHQLHGISGELFKRVDSPGIFPKGNIGFGSFNNGNMNDEDWGFRPPIVRDPTPYSNTITGQSDGRFTYYTADAGYDFLQAAPQGRWVYRLELLRPDV